MKKAMILIFSVIALSSAKAQVQFGVKAGLNIANLNISSNTTEVSPGSRTSFHAGLLASIPLASSFTVQPEINYSGQGAKANDFGETTTLKYDYLNVPVLVKYNHSSGLFAETGPQAGFLLGANASSGDQSASVKDQTQTFDFSWAFGIGYLVKSVNAGIDARYNLGLTNTAKQSTDGTAKNSVFQFGIFYLFGGAK